MSFEELKVKYQDWDPALPSHFEKLNKEYLAELIIKYNCSYPPSFIQFQLNYCTEVPIGDFAFEGFGFAVKEIDSYMSLEEVLKSSKEINLPTYLTPFKYENGDFWCFDNRESVPEYPVVIYSHNSNKIESDKNNQWVNFIDWLTKTMEEEF